MAKTKKPAAPAAEPENRIDDVLDQAVAEQHKPVEAEISPVAKPDTFRVNFSASNVLRGVRRQNRHYGGGGEPRWDIVVALTVGEDTEGFIVPSVPERIIEAE